MIEQTQPEKKSGFNFIALILVLVSIFPLIFGAYPFFKQIALDTIGVQTTGTVISLYGETEIRSPTVEFQTEDGEEVQFKSFYSTNYLIFGAGDEVEIRYLPTYPKIAEVNTLGRVHYLENFGTGCLGIFLLLMGGVTMMSKPLVLDLRKKNN
jgi:hypothetical protein